MLDREGLQLLVDACKQRWPWAYPADVVLDVQQAPVVGPTELQPGDPDAVVAVVAACDEALGGWA